MGRGEDTKNLGRYVSPVGAWALAFGCSVGWGAFVMPGTTFLPVAGPVGTLAGLAIGCLLMMVLAVNYHFMMNRCRGAGGAYEYACRAFGHDHGFLAGWFLILAYIVVFWGNATALPMIARYLLGDVFKFGWHYTLFGYDVYTGEVLLSVGAMLLCTLVCLRPKLALWLQIIFAVVTAAGVLVCAAGVFLAPGTSVSDMKPAFAPGMSPGSGIFSIVSLAPWAYVGFETISHSTGEFRFRRRKSFPVMAAALVFAFLTYGLLAVLSSAHLPGRFPTWADYMSQLDSFKGIAALPVFLSVETVLGKGGTILLGLSAFSAICTGLIGFATSSSRLLYSISLDDLLPRSFSKVNSRGVPSFAILSLLVVSLPVPCLGRTAINWLIDVTTICVVIAYGYVSASALHMARRERRALAAVPAAAGVVISCIFAIVFLVPNVLMIRTLSAESYLLIAVWSILGLLWFRIMSGRKNSRQRSFSQLVWGTFLALIIYTSLIWVIQTAAVVEENTSQKIEQYYSHQEEVHTAEEVEDGQKYVQEEMKAANTILRNASMIQISFIIVAMMIVFSIYGVMQKWAKQMEADKIRAEENSRAKSTFLSNMSHDIRTPMNAVIGMTEIASNNINDQERVKDCLSKISKSSKHLLGLINDVLDMSKIESGKMTLNEEALSLKETLMTVCDIVRPQTREKGQNFDVYVSSVLCEEVHCDGVRLKQVLLNFLSNAVKFTPEGGDISVRFWQKPSEKGDACVENHFEVRDNGMGMTKEFQEKLFTAFEREDSLRVHKTQGTGLGMSIARYIVDAMEGTIDVSSSPGAGTAFHVTVDLKRVDISEDRKELPKWKILVVDENEELRKDTSQALTQIGMIPVGCASGVDAIRLAQEAVDKGSGFYAVLLDYDTGGRDSFETAKRLGQALLSEAPACLIAAYDWTETEEDLEAAGISGHLAKPLFASELYRGLDMLQTQKEESTGKADQLQEERDLTGKRVLLAEDNDLNAEIATMILEEMGAEVDWAQNGRIAAEKFESSKEGYYDIVLMDLRMPEMNGIEATQAIRAMDRPDALKIPIIAMTADAFTEDIQRCLAAGMNEHLSKPIDVDRLKETLIKYI